MERQGQPNPLSAMIAVLLAAALLAGCGGCRLPSTDTDPERACLDYLVRQMTTAEGALLANAPVTKPFFGEAKPDRAEMERSGVLSESMGLLMLYAARADEKELFETQYSLLQSKMLAQCGLVYWKLTADLEMVANASASVDDLRIAHALLIAYRAWGDTRYLDRSLDLAQTIREQTAPDGRLRDFLNWRDYGEPTLADTITLSYLDIPAMRDLADIDPEWNEIADNALALLRASQTEAGLFPLRYNYATSVYEEYTVNAIQFALGGYYLATADPGNRRFLDFLRTKMDEDGRIYAAYDARTGEPTEFFESTSVYALAALTALAAGDDDFAGRLLGRMKQFQQRDGRSPMFGAFCDDEVYSFDNLLALLALRAGVRGTNPAGGDQDDE